MPALQGLMASLGELAIAPNLPYAVELALAHPGSDFEPKQKGNARNK
jgi:hypothetical protein